MDLAEAFFFSILNKVVLFFSSDEKVSNFPTHFSGSFIFKNSSLQFRYMEKKTMYQFEPTPGVYGLNNKKKFFFEVWIIHQIVMSKNKIIKLNNTETIINCFFRIKYT